MQNLIKKIKYSDIFMNKKKITQITYLFGYSLWKDHKSQKYQHNSGGPHFRRRCQKNCRAPSAWFRLDQKQIGSENVSPNLRIWIYIEEGRLSRVPTPIPAPLKNDDATPDSNTTGKAVVFRENAFGVIGDCFIPYATERDGKRTIEDDNCS